MTKLFSIDFETSGLNPFVTDHQPLSVGIAVADDETGDITSDEFYRRLKADLSPDWYDSTIPVSDDCTLAWWRKQNETARFEAYECRTSRHSLRVAWGDMIVWMNEVEPDPSKRFFAANPSGFEWMWLNRWAADTDTEVAEAAHYRIMCLRSASWGLDAHQSWGGSRPTSNKPLIEHHAYWDAYAQAQDLSDMILQRKRIAGLADHLVTLDTAKYLG